MTTFAAVCFVAALASELVGIALIVSEAKAANAALKDYLRLNPNGHAGGSYDQLGNLQPVIATALGNQVKRGWAIALLVVGVMAATAGNFATLV